MFTIGRESLHGPAMDFPVALLMELLKATQPGPRPMISPKEQAKRMRQGGWRAAPPAGSTAAAGCPRASEFGPATEVGFGVPLGRGEGDGAGDAAAAPPGVAEGS